jgi:hypothetical protein
MYSIELRDSRAQSRSAGMGCLLCGEIVDPVIAGNRTRSIQDFIQNTGSRVRRRRARRIVMR